MKIDQLTLTLTQIDWEQLIRMRAIADRLINDAARRGMPCDRLRAAGVLDMGDITLMQGFINALDIS